MGLMDAKEYDPRPAQRLWRTIIIAVVLIVVPLLVWWKFFWYWPEERVINKFFAALEHQDFDTAYGLYNADPDWKQHAARYNSYPLSQFTLDWGPSGDYGAITSHQIDCTTEPEKGGQTASGVIVVVTINKRSEPVSLWVEKKARTITTSPFQVLCHPPR